MSDKMRGALFNSLGDIEGLSVLDAFAGSGGLSLEAVSRGAKSVMAIELDKAAYKAIAENVKALGVSNGVNAIRANAGSWSRNKPDAKFDLVFLDPPYDDIWPDLLARLAAHAKGGGIAVLSLPADAAIKLGKDFKYLRSKDYGDAKLVFYRRVS